MDKVLTNKLQAWLDTPAEERDISEGILMFRKLSNNVVLYHQMLRFPEKLHKKLEYELRKYLNIRLDGLTSRDCMLMDERVIPSAEEVLTKGAPVVSADDERPEAQHVGKRADHEDLPQEIRYLYVRNGEVFFKMKHVFEELKAMEKQPSCDRYELLKVLDALDKEYRENWRKYDAYDPSQPVAPAAPMDEQPTANEVSAARKYISENRKKLAELLDADEQDEALALREEIQKRVQLVLKAGGGFKPDYQESLENLGIGFVEPADESQE